VVADSARFDVFGLGEAVLAGEAARALRVLAGLRAEGTEPTLVLWALKPRRCGRVERSRRRADHPPGSSATEPHSSRRCGAHPGCRSRRSRSERRVSIA